MARKKATKTVITKTEIFEDPQSRNEALLQNILGANNDLGDPQSRNEALLMNILGESYDIGEAQSRIETLLMRIKEEGLGTKITVDDLGKVVQETAPGEYGLVAQTAHAQITENGTFDTTNNNSVKVNVSGGGGGGGLLTPDYQGLSYGYINGANFWSSMTNPNYMNIYHLEHNKLYLFFPSAAYTQANRRRCTFFGNRTYADFKDYVENPFAEQRIQEGISLINDTNAPVFNPYWYTPSDDGELIWVTSNESKTINIYAIEVPLS